MGSYMIVIALSAAPVHKLGRGERCEQHNACVKTLRSKIILLRAPQCAVTKKSRSSGASSNDTRQ